MDAWTVGVAAPALAALLASVVAVAMRRVNHTLTRMEKVCDAFEGRPATPGYPRVLGVLELLELMQNALPKVTDLEARVTRLELAIPAQRRAREDSA